MPRGVGAHANSVGAGHHLWGCSWEAPQGGPLELWLGWLGTGAKPSTTSSCLSLHTAQGHQLSPSTLTLANWEPMEGGPGAHALLPVGWLRFHPHRECLWRLKGEGNEVTQPCLLSRKFATQNKNCNWNHKKGHLGAS